MWSLDDLLDFVACPACKERLVRNGNELRCSSCSHSYPTHASVPVLLTESSRHHAEIAKERLEREYVYPLSAGLRRLRKRVAPPSPFWSPRRRQIGAALRPYFEAPDAVVLHLGAKEANLGHRVVHIDLYPFTGVDLVTDAECLGIASASVDCVYLPALLEHVPHPANVIAEVRRVLKPRGLIVVEVPFMQGYHADPDDYQRFTLSGLRVLLEGFDELDAGALAGPSSSLAYVLRGWLAAWVPRHRLPRAHRAARILAGWGTFWMRYADALLIRSPASHELASGLYFLGTKTAEPTPVSE